MNSSSQSQRFCHAACDESISPCRRATFRPAAVHWPAALLAAGLLALPAWAGGGRIWWVDDDAPIDPGPNDPYVSSLFENGSLFAPFDAIQEAIDAASDGDMVLIRAGSYDYSPNTVNFGSKAIEVRSEDGPAVTYCSRRVTFASSAGPAILDGLSFREGPYDDGGFGYDPGLSATDASPQIQNCTVEHGATPYWATITGGAPSFSGCTIFAPNGGTLKVQGGASVTFEDTIFDGAGIEYDLFEVVDSSFTAVDCVFVHQHAVYDTLLHLNNAQAVLQGCLLLDNQADPYDGLITAEGAAASVTMEACRVVNNLGGLRVLTPGASATLRDVLYLDNGPIELHDGGGLVLENCTLASNQQDRLLQIDSGTATVSNSVFVNTNLPIQLNGGDLQVTYTALRGGAAAVEQNGGTLSLGDGIVADDPGLTGDRLHLRADSPCRDAGDPAGDYGGRLDVDGEARVVDGAADIGVDEWLDTDADALPDWWESAYFGSTTGADATQDSDGDGAANLDEYNQGTNAAFLPGTLYVAIDGDDAYDGRAEAFDGLHGPKATIQAALDAAFEGDEIEVLDGTYTGPGNFDLTVRRDTTIRSQNGPEVTILDGGGLAPLLMFDSHAVALEGLTLRNGRNPAYGQGGAIRVAGGTLTATRCEFLENGADCIVMSAGVGGAVYLDPRSQGFFEDCRFEGNAALLCGYGHQEWAHGGAVYAAGPAVFRGCEFASNVANGGAAVSGRDNVVMQDCWIHDHFAKIEPILSGVSAVLDSTLERCAGDDSWGPSLFSVRLAISSSFYDMAQGGYWDPLLAGSAVDCLFSGIGPWGASLIYQDLVNCTISDCSLQVNGEHTTIENCILWGNTAGTLLYVGQSDSLTVSHSIVEGGMASVDVDGGTLNWLDGNLDADPLFVDPNNGDYHVAAGSPAIDAGDNAALPPDTYDLDNDGDTAEPLPLDLDGNPRVQNGIVDIGAYESQSQGCTGDLNGDGAIDLADLSILLANFGAAGAPEQGDLNGDGQVDLADLSILLTVFGQLCG